MKPNGPPIDNLPRLGVVGVREMLVRRRTPFESEKPSSSASLNGIPQLLTEDTLPPGHPK